MKIIETSGYKSSYASKVKKDSDFIKEGDEDPCWDGYEQVGTKKKDGKEVPNCVPKKKSSVFMLMQK